MLSSMLLNELQAGSGESRPYTLSMYRFPLPSLVLVVTGMSLAERVHLPL